MPVITHQVISSQPELIRIAVSLMQRCRVKSRGPRGCFVRSEEMPLP